MLSYGLGGLITDCNTLINSNKLEINYALSIQMIHQRQFVFAIKQTDNKGLNWATYNKNGEPKICNYKSGVSTQSAATLINFIKQDH
jgi:hypothetical protein